LKKSFCLGRFEEDRVRLLSAALVALGAVACATGSEPAKPSADIVRAEFTKRLGAYQGELQLLEIGPGGVAAKWRSGRCDMLEGEVIDFLISLHRGHSARVPGAIKAERVCGGETRHFQTTASQFDQYRTGRINDAAVLRGVR
jgi:hypothetical protein